MRNLIIILGIILTVNISYSQCETNTTELDDGRKVISMTERFYQNDDLENGVKTFYVSANSFVLADETSFFELAVTYMSIRTSYWIVPNTLKIGLKTGEEILLKSKEKSSQTLNRIKPIPNTARGVECYFRINYDDLLKILGTESISYLIVEDYKTGEKFDITPYYKKQLSELMKCVLKL
ncbi:hypothetical protein [Mariniflexile maritimum]|uniref:hypothetical protein n=1 Tax=Mariniflexile maritimum TaxID=2682493 RepID=UPI0012F69502|nr:hypothetical protein [Mariniflexile maritimum]